MQDLIERLEKVTGPDRELDADIFIEERRPLHGEPDPKYLASVRSNAPYYTSSIDAALTLMPPGWSRQLRTAEHHENGYVVEVWKSWGPDAYKRTTVRHLCEPVALCIAALKARAASENPADENKAT